MCPHAPPIARPADRSAVILIARDSDRTWRAVQITEKSRTDFGIGIPDAVGFTRQRRYSVVGCWPTSCGVSSSSSSFFCRRSSLSCLFFCFFSSRWRFSNLYDPLFRAKPTSFLQPYQIAMPNGEDSSDRADPVHGFQAAVDREAVSG